MAMTTKVHEVNRDGGIRVLREAAEAVPVSQVEAVFRPPTLSVPPARARSARPTVAVKASPAGTALAPACRIGEHDECPGPAELRLTDAPAWERPVEVHRCACSCHTH